MPNAMLTSFFFRARPQRLNARLDASHFVVGMASCWHRIGGRRAPIMTSHFYTKPKFSQRRFLMILNTLVASRGSISKVLGTLGHPCGHFGHQGRFQTPIFHIFLRPLAALSLPRGPQVAPKCAPERPMVPKMRPKVVPKAAKCGLRW